MPNIIFYLNTGAKNDEGIAPVLAKIIFNKKRYYKTIARIKSVPDIKDSKGKITGRGDWNLVKCRVNKNHKNSPYNRHKEINATINHLEKLTNDFNDYCLLNNVTISEKAITDILNGIDPISGRKAANRPEISFNDAFKQWVEHTKANNEFNTYKSRNTVYNFLLKFQKNTKVVISFTGINMDLFDQLKRYSIDEMEYSNNTFAKTIKVFKMFLNWCFDRELFTGKLPKDFKASEHDITPITLTIEEFKKLYYFEFKNKKFQKVRDIFCFGCLTGLRYSDLQRLRGNWINNEIGRASCRERV